MSNHSAPKSTATPYVLKKYKPKPRDQRVGIGLCLSGGGYRALLFHLGALRRLNELGLLAKLKTISAVSGGSIIAAHLAINILWPLNERLSDTDWEHLVADPLRPSLTVGAFWGPVTDRRPEGNRMRRPLRGLSASCPVEVRYTLPCSLPYGSVQRSS